ncbi:hypothetical protein NP233_g7094 [Leucocoprinus birnbaumii]|uniref:HTH CENPB-type domain-containing protein n=1 Tax=Leucocoprinus birnbaumii TaxID=56174 RepID=A0AAD5VVC9_9AGAR|nr:hypothetical protein NP233_g7094 [Leucocoprinus birnbaumii]
MVKHAQSTRVKQQKKLEPQEHRLQAAAADYAESKARVTEVGKTMLEYSTAWLKLLPREESMLVALIIESAEHGLPMTKDQIEHYANCVLEARLGSKAKPVGKRWLDGLLTRHCEEIQTLWSKPLATQRAQCLNPNAVKSWFGLLKVHVVDAGTHPADIYGMDESGFPTAYAGMDRVYVPQGTKVQHKRGGGDRENITAIVTICADGSTIRPLIIHKGKLVNSRWTDNNVANAFFTVSERGWTDGDIGLKWLQDVFDAETREQTQSSTRVLILNGHNSHYTLQFLEYAREHNITVLGYPPHCTHALQGLDVVCFAKMKQEFKKVVANFEANNGRDVKKADFTGLFGTAFNNSFSIETVQAAFQATAYPDTTNDTENVQIDPTLLNLEVPAERLGVLCQNLGETSSGAFLVSDDTHTSDIQVTPPFLEFPPSLPPIDWSLVKDRPTAGWVSQQTYATELDELRTQLTVAKTHLEAHRACLTSQNAQLVFQGLHLQHMHGILFKKNAKESDNSGVHIDGGGAVLTDEAIIERFRAKEAQKKAKAEEKEMRKKTREKKKEAQA